ncbi:GPI-anchored small secreted protein [Suillus bovinus]|uniref:GPI-anchored small secreted protein n=1 Tax=Suillus bovinus TaxID=48563 RepID=UPI001B85B452|nr:GPI-anchored small secreted protein [Suillus bovinus]KAG2154972.1 GPI-anchored small secreted protein [Suillus bovinus]
MRSSVAILLASIASAFAYEVTSPGDSEGWTTAGPNVLTWERVDTDPLNFTAVLTNNYGVMNPQVLNALVDGTQSSIVCNAPSGGWPTGAGFRVNLAADAQHLDTLLAQSNQFDINSTSTSSTTGSTTKTSSTATSLFSGTTGTVPTTAVAASTTSSDTSTTPTSSSAALLGMKVETGLLTGVAAFVAFITTHF